MKLATRLIVSVLALLSTQTFATTIAQQTAAAQVNCSGFKAYAKKSLDVLDMYGVLQQTAAAGVKISNSQPNATSCTAFCKSKEAAYCEFHKQPGVKNYTYCFAVLNSNYAQLLVPQEFTGTPLNYGGPCK